MEDLSFCIWKCVSSMTLPWGYTAEAHLSPSSRCVRELMKVNIVYSTAGKPGAPY